MRGANVTRAWMVFARLARALVVTVIALGVPGRAHAQEAPVRTIEHGSWADTVEALQRDLGAEGQVVHVIVEHDGARDPCGSYTLALDAIGVQAFRVLGCDPLTSATALRLEHRAALFEHDGGLVPRPRTIRLVATELRVEEAVGGGQIPGGSGLTCSVSLRPYLEDLEHGTRVVLTPERYVVRPLAADVEASGAGEGWTLRSMPRASLRIEYDVVDRASGEVVLHDEAVLSCASGPEARATEPTSSTTASPSPATPEGVSVRFVAERRDTTVYRVDAGATDVPERWQMVSPRRTAEPLCSPPCTATLTPGVHGFGLSIGNGPAVIAEGVLDIRRSGTVTVTYVDNSAMRTAGWLTGLGGLLLSAGGAVSVIGLQDADPDVAMGVSLSMVLTGFAGIITGLMIGLATQDGAVFHFD